ncbi:MAG: fimbrial protein [Moraxella sp.]
MKKALVAVAILAASSSAFAATENRVLIAGNVFGETCVIEDKPDATLGLPAISQSQVKDNVATDGLQSTAQFDITLGQCSVNHIKKVALKFDTKVTEEGYLENTSNAAGAAKGVALALYESDKTGGTYEFLSLKDNVYSKKQVNIKPNDKGKVTFHYGVDYIKTGGVDVQPGPVSSLLKYDIAYK